MCVFSKKTNLSLAALNLGKNTGEWVEVPPAQDSCLSVSGSGSQGKHKKTGWADICWYFPKFFFSSGLSEPGSFYTLLIEV